MNLAVDVYMIIGPLIAAVLVVALLLGAFWMGVRIWRREPPPPRPEEQPRLPDEGPVGEVRENREPEEVPRSRHRLTPHRLKAHGNVGSRTSSSEQRPRWDRGSSGSFGSGGPGAHR
ncbi:DUF6479 family protein [Streptomyces sp. TP-A0356]|uniref:DUF6479 family protein n=1 Tax=Streptomyces sp. TP-A0356 TaxID=1359208 RepID=UPI001F193BC4